MLIIANLRVYQIREWGGQTFEVLTFAYLLITVYAFLPPDAHGLLGWFKPTSGTVDNEMDVEPLSLRSNEPKIVRPDREDAPLQYGSLNFRAHCNTFFYRLTLVYSTSHGLRTTGETWNAQFESVWLA